VALGTEQGLNQKKIVLLLFDQPEASRDSPDELIRDFLCHKLHCIFPTKKVNVLVLPHHNMKSGQSDRPAPLNRQIQMVACGPACEYNNLFITH
jgi:hypothetical protein